LTLENSEEDQNMETEKEQSEKDEDKENFENETTNQSQKESQEEVDSEENTPGVPDENTEISASEKTTNESIEESKKDSNLKSSEDMPYIKDEELDSQFKYEILNEPGGENFLRCMQCGTCTASCPVKVIDPDYNCRRIIRMALIGDKEQVLKSKFIWMCSTCYSCYERCPADVKITDLMTALKNIAVKHGYIHPNIKELITYLEKFGGLTEVSDFENRMREKFGMPKINQSPVRVQKVLEKVKIKKIIEGEN
jgi:heterodisulfide reductase subunit C